MDLYSDSIRIGDETLHFEMPNSCPHCGKTMRAGTALWIEKTIAPNTHYLLLFICTHNNCKKSYLGWYIGSQNTNTSKALQLVHVYPPSGAPPVAESIIGTSTRFVAWYNQAYAAEARGENDLAACAYRCALEVLVKDFAMKYCNAKPEELTDLNIGVCLVRYVKGIDAAVAGYWATQYSNGIMHYPPRDDIQFDYDAFKKFYIIALKEVDTKITLAMARADLPEKLQRKLDSLAESVALPDA